MGGPFGFGAPKEMDMGFDCREEEGEGSAEGMMNSKRCCAARRGFHEMSKDSSTIAHSFNAKPL